MAENPRNDALQKITDSITENISAMRLSSTMQFRMRNRIRRSSLPEESTHCALMRKPSHKKLPHLDLVLKPVRSVPFSFSPKKLKLAGCASFHNFPHLRRASLGDRRSRCLLREERSQSQRARRGSFPLTTDANKERLKEKLCRCPASHQLDHSSFAQLQQLKGARISISTLSSAKLRRNSVCRSRSVPNASSKKELIIIKGSTKSMHKIKLAVDHHLVEINSTPSSDSFITSSPANSDSADSMETDVEHPETQGVPMIITDTPLATPTASSVLSQFPSSLINQTAHRVTEIVLAETPEQNYLSADSLDSSAAGSSFVIVNEN